MPKCLGSHQLPTRTTVYNMQNHPVSGWCPVCGLEYVLNNDGLIRTHRTSHGGSTYDH